MAYVLLFPSSGRQSNDCRVMIAPSGQDRGKIQIRHLTRHLAMANQTILLLLMIRATTPCDTSTQITDKIE